MSIETYISEFSKYIIALIAVIYSAADIAALLIKKEEKRKGIYLAQVLLIFGFHFSSFMVICFETKDIRYLVFYFLQLIVIYAFLMLFKFLYPNTSRLIINNICMLTSISFVILTRMGMSRSVRQFFITGVAMAIALVIPLFIHNLKFLKNLKWIYAISGIALLGLMLLLGRAIYGSKISYSIAGISFQPAEFVKIIFIFFVASSLYKSSGIIDIFITGVIAAVFVMIQVLNRDLGSALIFFVVFIFMVYVSSGNIIYLILGVLAGGGASYIAFRLFSHVRARIMAWRDPFSYIDGIGYQITQSLFGISSGGWFGLGLYKGSPSSIPFVHVDFIFSAIAEELGIIFAVCMIIICFTTFAQVMKASLGLRDKFYQLIAFGIGIEYIFQVFLTIGGGSKFIPLTGITLPFVSYGGSSILSCFIMFSIVEGMYIIREDEIREGIRESFTDEDGMYITDNRKKNERYYR